MAEKFQRRYLIQNLKSFFTKTSVETMRSYNLADDVADLETKPKKALRIEQDHFSVSRPRPARKADPKN